MSQEAGANQTERGSSPPIRVFLVEDDTRLVKVLGRVFEREPGLELVGVSLSGEDAQRALAGDTAPKTHVVLLDLELPGMGGLSVLRWLRENRPDLEVLIHTSFKDQDRVFEAIRDGAAGYLVKGAETHRLVRAIIDVYNGGVVIEPELARRFWHLFESSKRSGRDPDAPELTEAELELLSYVGKGLSNAEAGHVMGLERRTIRTILGHIYTKLGVNNRVQAVTEGLRMGLIDL